MGRYARNIMMKQTALFIVFAMLVACSGISVTNDWDPGVNFSQFKTFVVLKETQPSIDQLVDQNIRTAIVAELTAKGLRRTDIPEKADLAIGYQVTTEERSSYQPVRSGWGYYGYESKRAVSEKVNVTMGTLVIAAFRMKGKKLVWEGSASGTVDSSSQPEQRENRINDAVRRIFKDFPPG